jgi:hypothetical protein
MPKMTCTRCGNQFKNDLALKIHVGRMHAAKAKAKPGPKPGRRAAANGPAFAVGFEITAMPIDDLLKLKRKIDARLADIRLRMREVGL